MKYECVNCYSCCLSANSQGSYCALPSECTQPLLSYQQAIGFTILIVFLLAAALACLYFAFRNRKLPVSESPHSQHEVQSSNRPEESPVVQVKSTSTKEKLPQIKTNEHLQIQSRFSSNRKSRTYVSGRSTPKKSTTQTDTERGFRSPSRQ